MKRLWGVRGADQVGAKKNLIVKDVEQCGWLVAVYAVYCLAVIETSVECRRLVRAQAHSMTKRKRSEESEKETKAERKGGKKGWRHLLEKLIFEFFEHGKAAQGDPERSRSFFFGLAEFLLGCVPKAMNDV